MNAPPLIDPKVRTALAAMFSDLYSIQKVHAAAAGQDSHCAPHPQARIVAPAD
jgi:hypothetical protein